MTASGAVVPPVLAITGGHRVDLPAFGELLDAACEGWAAWEHATQPSAQALLVPEHAGRWSAVVLHDIAGLRLGRGTEPEHEGPSAATRDALRELLDRGQGLLVLHHAIASWPAWDGWAHAIGGRFLYASGYLDGRPYPASGYRLDTHTIDVLAPEHPVCAGVDSFTVDDELYLCPVLQGEVVPLLATRADLDAAGFRDTYAEVRHGRTDVTCGGQPAASRLVGWVKVAGNSPVVYLQPGHGPATFAHPAYRRLVANALRWLGSPESHAWARSAPTPLP